MSIRVGNQCPTVTGTIPHPCVDPIISLDGERLYVRNGTAAYVYNYPALTLRESFSLGASTGQWCADFQESLYWNEGFLIRKRTKAGVITTVGTTSGLGFGANGNLWWDPDYSNYSWRGFLNVIATRSTTTLGPYHRRFDLASASPTYTGTTWSSNRFVTTGSYRGDIISPVYKGSTILYPTAGGTSILLSGNGIESGISQVLGLANDGGLVARKSDGTGLVRLFGGGTYWNGSAYVAHPLQRRVLGCPALDVDMSNHYFTYSHQGTLITNGQVRGSGSVFSLSIISGAQSTVYEWRPIPVEQSVVVGGPNGDWRYNAVDNPAGGIVEKGWPQGARLGESDDIWIHDYANGEEIKAQHVTPLDSEYAIVFYQRVSYQGNPLDDAVGDDYWGDWDPWGDRVTQFAALIHRRGNALYTLQSDVFVGKAMENSYRQGVVSTRLNNTTAAVGYTGWYNYEWDPAGSPGEFDSAGQPAVSVVRRVGNTLEVVAHTMDWDYSNFTLQQDSLWTRYAGANWWPTNEMNVLQIIRLSDTKFVICGIGQPSTDWNYFDRKGSIIVAPNPPNANGWDHDYTLALWACELDDSDNLTWGAPCIPGYEGSYLQVLGDAIGDDRIIIHTYEHRAEFRDRSKIDSDATVYWWGHHVRTCDIDGLTITENKHNGLYRIDMFNPSYGYLKVLPKMFNTQDGVLLYQRDADLQPTKWWRPLSRPNSEPINGWDTGDMSHAYYIHTGPGNTGPIAMPAALRFSVGTDGSVTSTWKEHVLDASPSRFTDIDWADGLKNDSYSGTYPRHAVSGYGADLVNGHIFATFYTNTYYNDASPFEWNVPQAGIWKGTWLIMDENSPSGLGRTGYRHLGIDEESMDWNNHHEMDLKFFPGTEFVIGCPPIESYYSPIIDGPGLSPEYYRNFPQHREQVFDFFWDTPGHVPPYWNPWWPDYGFYPRQSSPMASATYNYTTNQYDTVYYTESYPHAELLAYDGYGEVGLRGLVEPEYGQDPWEMIEYDYNYDENGDWVISKEPDFLYRPRFDWSEDKDDFSEIDAYYYVRVHIWRVIPPGIAGGQVTDERIMRTGGH